MQQLHSKMSQSARLTWALEFTNSLGPPTKVYEYENHMRLYFTEQTSVHFYYHVNGTLEEIQTVDCDLEHEKITHRYRSVGPDTSTS